MSSAELDGKQIYDLATDVLRRLGQGVQADVEETWHRYEDEQISILSTSGYYDATFRVHHSGSLVLEVHQVRRHIETKEDLLRDMLQHGFCDDRCPGFRHAVAQRAHQIYQRRTTDASAQDDWLQAEQEILAELERRYPGDWEVATLYGRDWMAGKPVACVLLKRGPWIDHLAELVRRSDRAG